MNRKVGLLQGFLIRVCGVLIGIAVGTVAVVVVPSPVPRLTFDCTAIGCGSECGHRQYKASDGAKLSAGTCYYPSTREARAYMQSLLVDTPTVVERGVERGYNGAYGERIVAVGDSSAMIVWRDGTTIWSVAGPTLTHVKQLLEQDPHP